MSEVYEPISYTDYTKTTWECGDVINANKLNKIEGQLANLGGVRS